MLGFFVFFLKQISTFNTQGFWILVLICWLVLYFCYTSGKIACCRNNGMCLCLLLVQLQWCLSNFKRKGWGSCFAVSHAKKTNKQQKKEIFVSLIIIKWCSISYWLIQQRSSGNVQHRNWMFQDYDTVTLGYVRDSGQLLWNLCEDKRDDVDGCINLKVGALKLYLFEHTADLDILKD